MHFRSRRPVGDALSGDLEFVADYPTIRTKNLAPNKALRIEFIYALDCIVS
jgi:hypothetical protein